MGWITTTWHRLGSPRWFYGMMAPWQTGFGIAALVLLAVGSVWGLVWAPADYQQGDSFRIIYIHVPTVIVAQSAYMTLGAAGLVLLVWRMKMADVAMVAIVPFGMAMTALGLFTGSVWGRPTWGTWWEWTDARLVSTLILLFLYFGLHALRQAIPAAESAARACAVLAIAGLVNIPIIKYSVEWWTTLHQGSTFSMRRINMPAVMYLPLLVNVIGMYCLFGYVMIARMRTEILRRERDTSWVVELVRRPDVR
ncbi:MAG: heme ABC transporter permease CcmC [Pseudomonadales bacterium]